MDAKKYSQIIKSYRGYFISKGIKKKEFPHGAILFSSQDDKSLEHCHSMLDKMEEFIKEERFPKLNRWLGFIQGVLWRNGIATMNNLKNTNRPDR